ncbi:MAG: hypothetical protein IPJ71_18730 [Bdellovibrionales bacterium]|nr:hypothetical protein [Bdellovibrionales bacterium]
MKSRRSYRSTAMLLLAVLFLKLFGCKVNNTIQGIIGSDSNKISVSLEGGSSSVTIAEGSNTNFVLILSSPLAAEASLEWSILDVNGTAATLEFPTSSGTIVFPQINFQGTLAYKAPMMPYRRELVSSPSISQIHLRLAWILDQL